MLPRSGESSCSKGNEQAINCSYGSSFLSGRRWNRALQEGCKGKNEDLPPLPGGQAKKPWQGKTLHTIKV